MNYRAATSADCALLAELNYQLIHDEGHRNPMTVVELVQRMKRWLSEGYAAILFDQDGTPVAYALFLEQSDEIYLRQLFVIRHRRRTGIGRQAVEILRSRIWPANKRLTVSVLTSNTSALAFWRAVGFSDYCLTLEIVPDKK